MIGADMDRTETSGTGTAQLPLMETRVVTHDLSADDASIRTEAAIE